MGLTRTFVALCVVAISTLAAHADWYGDGIIVGEVIDSRREGSTLVFRARILRQEIANGPRLGGNPWEFSHEGPAGLSLSRGDLVRMQVDGSNGPITVTRLERATRLEMLRVDGVFAVSVVASMFLASLAAAILVGRLRRRRKTAQSSGAGTDGT
jgi:hypothetical protein